MLKQPLPARTRKLSGSIAVAILMAAASYTAWATQPAQPAKATASNAAAPWITHVDAIDRMDAPKYPADAEAKGINGMVVLELLVGVDGKVKEARAVKSEPAGVFDQAAIDAALKWQVKSALEGKAVERRFRTQIDFVVDVKKPKQD